MKTYIIRFLVNFSLKIFLNGHYYDDNALKTVKLNFLTNFALLLKKKSVKIMHEEVL